MICTVLNFQHHPITVIQSVFKHFSCAIKIIIIQNLKQVSSHLHVAGQHPSRQAQLFSSTGTAWRCCGSGGLVALRTMATAPRAPWMRCSHAPHHLPGVPGQPCATPAGGILIWPGKLTVSYTERLYPDLISNVKNACLMTHRHLVIQPLCSGIWSNCDRNKSQNIWVSG